MRIAIVHELLTMKGGAEKVLRILADLYPNAPIYTLLYNEEKLGDWFPKGRVRTSSLAQGKFFKLCSLLRPSLAYNHHLYLPFFPKAVEAWDFKNYDLVISTSSAFVHGIITNGNPKHISYIHSPARYLWDRTHDVLERAGTGKIGFLRKAYLEHVFQRLRTWDAEVAPRADKLIAPSKEVQRRIQLYWREESSIIYPPIDDFWFESIENSSTSNSQPVTRNYYLIVSTLVPYKQIDIAIKACNALEVPLIIAGEGPERKQLEKIAGSTVKFLGYVPDEEIKELYVNAKATLFPGREDFGLVPVESMACGTPVIAQRSGGALETIIEGKTGTFFDEPTAASLQKVLQNFDAKDFLAADCKKRAEEFSRARFEKKMQKVIHEFAQEIGDANKS